MKRLLTVNQKLKKRTPSQKKLQNKKKEKQQQQQNQPQNKRKIKLFDFLNKDAKRNRR